MSKNYTCGHCNSVFESGSVDPRCPKCLRISRIKECLKEKADQKPSGRQRKTHGQVDDSVRDQGKGYSLPAIRYSWLLPVGTAMTAIGLVAVLAIVYSDCRAEKSLGEAFCYAVLGGVGLGLIVVSLLKSRKN